MVFAEVLLAVFIIGTVLSSSLLLQNTLFSNVFTITARFERMFLLKNRFVQEKMRRVEQSKEKRAAVPNAAFPDTKISYTTKKPDKSSSLKQFKSIMIEQAKATWKENLREQSESMITLLFRPEKQKK
jgi:Tfp pilus assembly protein PilV